MKRTLLVAAVLLSCAAGCVSAPGASRFAPVDLTQNLDAPTLERYRAEHEAVTRAGQTGQSLLLERTNRWPLGLVAYWRQGSVEVVHTHGGPAVFMVTASRGYGPLSAFWITSRTSTFSESGELLHGMDIGSALFGHVAMLHSMDSGHGHGQKSLGLLHHLLNFDWGHGRTAVSFFSGPNPAGFGR